MGEDLWQELLDLVRAPMSCPELEVRAVAREVCEEEEEQIGDLEEVAERYHLSLDPSESVPEEARTSDWPEGWQEERIWGDLSPEERRSLHRLLGTRAPKRMDT